MSWVLSGYWPVILAVLAIVYTSGRRPASLHAVFVTVSLACLAICLVVAFKGAAVPANNRLARDVFAFTVLGVSAPVLAYGSALLCRRASSWIRAIVPLAVGIAPIWASPLVLLMVHCSSGDCL